jgi:hypothetical protein
MCSVYHKEDKYWKNLMYERSILSDVFFLFHFTSIHISKAPAVRLNKQSLSTPTYKFQISIIPLSIRMFYTIRLFPFSNGERTKKSKQNTFSKKQNVSDSWKYDFLSCTNKRNNARHILLKGGRVQ